MTSTRFSMLVKTPLGPMQLVADGDELLGAHLPDFHDDTPAGTSRTLSLAAMQLAEYFANKRRAFTIPLGARGTGFQERVWRALTAIPFGETRTYGELAALIGRPSASRAVGAANGKNPIAIIVPCHRVIGANGSLTGYAGGMAAKQWLLEHERAQQVLVRVGGAHPSC